LCERNKKCEAANTSTKYARMLDDLYKGCSFHQRPSENDIQPPWSGDI